MSKVAIIYTSPNESPIHISLRMAVERAGFDAENLKNLLWLINAHHQLIAFPRICQNIIKILDVAKSQWQVSATDFHLDKSVPIMHWIVEHTNELSSSLGENFDRQPKHNRDHPLLSRGASRHPLYTTLWNTCEAPHLQNKFFLLQGHLLIAHARLLYSAHNRDEYEKHYDQKEWKGIPNSPYDASLAVRDLSELINADLLSSLAAELEPNEFARFLSSIHPENVELQNRLKALKTFLQKSVGQRNWVQRTSSGGIGVGGSRYVTGYVKITDQLHLQDMDAGDPDDLDEDWGTQTLVSEIQPDHEEQQELLASDLFSDEFDTPELLLTGYGENTANSGGIAASGPAQLRHVVMANQLFPWAYSQLSVSELGSFLSVCSDWIRLIQLNNQTFKSADIEKLESICLMHVMIFTGSDFERARNLLVLPRDKQNEDAALALINNDEKTSQWRMRAIQPDYKTSRAATDGSERLRVDYFSLPDLAQTAKFLNILLKQHDKQSQNQSQGTSRNYRLFRRHADTLRHNLKTLLGELDPTGRLTETKLHRYMFNRLLQECNGDICAASMLAGEVHILARVRLFYSILPVKELQQKYINATAELVKLLHAASYKQYSSDQTTAIDSGENHVGSRLCTTLGFVKGAVAKLKQAIQLSVNDNDFTYHHNLYTLFNVWHFAFSTACRAIETPYLPLSEVDTCTGIGLLSDKDDGTGYKSRLIWLPPPTIAQMHLYEIHRAAILPHVSNLQCQDCPPVFFLERKGDDRLDAISVRPKSMQPIMEHFLSYPANFHRRFMRTELLDRGCPSEIIDAWMGHWYMGEEPWALHSSFSFHAYREELERYLVPLLDEIGLNGEVDTPQPVGNTVIPSAEQQS